MIPKKHIEDQNLLEKAVESIDQASIILIAPLDWGLGHASRCIPIIELLIKKNKSVYLASNGLAAKLLRRTFPSLPLINLPGYDIRYPFRSMVLNILWQRRKIIAAIKKENRVAEQIVANKKIDLIISDNRYGIYSSRVKSIFVGHQLQIQENR